ncbi:TPA: Palmitoyl-protein thioesterase 1 [Trebouxia sp. C0006]
MQGGAVLQKVCRRWRSAVTLMESQMPLSNTASQYLQDGPTCISHLSMSSMERFFTSRTNPSWGYTAKTSSPEKLLRQLHSGHSQRNFSSSPANHEPSSGPQLPVSWLNDVLPARLLPYAHLMRLDKPIGTWLLVWPCFWSIALAAPPGSLPDPGLLALFGTGAILLRGAGCTVNDLWDRDLDSKVERTKSRPLASGALTVPQGIGLLGGQLLLGLGILLQLNDFSKVVGASSLALVFAYPLMKRITFWPQAFLGLTFNWGALLGYAAVHGYLDWQIVPLYAHGVCWTLVYDTIYAHQDKDDDIVVGIKSTALLFGDNTRAYLAAFATTSIGFLSLTGYMMSAGLPYYAGVTAAACHYSWQLSQVDLDSRQDCLAKFVSNKWFGALVFTGIMADKLLAQSPGIV